MKKTLALFLAVVMTLCVLSGCGGNNAPANNDSGKTNSSDNSGTSTDTPSSDAGETRDTLNVSTVQVVSSIHPWDGANLVNNQLRFQLYDSFYFYNDLTQEFEPRLAESHEVSEDGMVYTFHLREDATFHNGDPVLASDAVYSVNRAIEHPSMASFTAAIDKAEAVDEHTVAITLKNPSSPFMSNLVNVLIASEKACEEAGDSLGNSAVLCGSGPYFVKDYNPDVTLVLEAYADYYRGEAAIKTVNYKPIVDTSTGLIAFENGELDFYNVPSRNWEEISSSGKYNTQMVAENHITYLAINYTGVLADKNLRLAIAHCLDKDTMSLASYGGLTEIAHGMLNPTYVFGAPSDPIEYEYNLEKAKEYLVKAGYPDGVDIGTILTIGGGYHEKNCIVLQDCLSQIGITVTIEPMEQAAAIAKAATGDFDLWTCGYACQSDYDFWRAITHTESNANGFVKFADAPAELGLNSDKIDALYDQASVELDPEVRKDLYKQLDDALMDTVTYLPIFHRSATFAWNKDLNTVLHSNYYYLYDFSWN